MTLDSSRRAVFDTNELLEHILSYLPFNQLFVLQSVSKQWRGVITSSPGLQEKMHLRPHSTTPEETWILENYDYHGPLVNLSMYKMAVDRAGAPRFRRNDGIKTMLGKSLVPLTLNPMLSLADPHPIVDNGMGRVLLRDNTGVGRMPAIERSCLSFSDTVSICLRPGDIRQNCSMRNLCLSDPPSRVAEVKLMVKFHGAKPYQPYAQRSFLYQRTGFRVVSEAGITIGDILTAASKSTGYNCCEFDDGYVWRDLNTEVKDMASGTKRPSGMTGTWEVESVTLYIDLLGLENRPLVVTEEERSVVAAAEDRAAAMIAQGV
jgi:hypothetical protein